MNIRAHDGQEMTGTDAEACAYLYTASLTQPMDSDWTQIYLYIATQVYSCYRSNESGVQVPEDIQVKSLSDYQTRELRRFKDWLYQRRVRERQERGRAETRERREQESSTKRDRQPALFEF